MNSSVKKTVYKIDPKSGNLLCNGKSVEPITNPLQYIDEYMDRIVNPIKEQIERSYKSIDAKSLMIEPLNQIEDYIKALDAVSPAKLAKEQLENAASSILREYDTDILFKTANDYLNTLGMHISSQKEMMAMAAEAQKSLIGLGEYAKAFTLSAGIIIPQKEIILTDEGFTFDQKLMALDLTARKFQTFIDEEIEDEKVKDLAIELTLNMQMIGYPSNESTKANQHIKRVKTFFEHLTNAQANRVQEDKEGFYYILLLEALIRYIFAYVSLQEPLNVYKKDGYRKLIALVDTDNFNHIVRVVKILKPFVPKSNQKPIKLDMSIIYLLANSLQCNYEYLAKAFFYILYSHKSHPKYISKIYDLNPSELLQIISF